MDNWQCLRLISLYRENKCLWDPNDTNYTNRGVREDVWRQISLEMTYPTEELKKKMRSLSGGYRRERFREKQSRLSGSGAGDTYKSKWFAYDDFAFMADKNYPGTTRDTLQQTQHGTNLLNHLRNNHDEDYQKVKVLNELTYPKKDSKETDGPRSLSTSSTLPDPQMAEEQEESVLAGKKKSNHVQKYFKTSGPDNVCNICDKTIKGHHASNLMEHLKQHPEQFSQLEKLNQQQMPHSWTRVDIKVSPSSGLVG